MIVDRYYYHQLNKQEQAIYKAFYKGVMSHQEIIPIPVRGEFSQESFERIFMAMTRDNPLIYFLNQSACSTASDMFEHIAICPQYFFTKEKVKEYNRKIEKVVNELAGQLHLLECNDYEKEKYRNINENNYYKIVTDLIGMRIIIRYREDWIKVDKWIMDHFGQNKELYIKNYIDDYKADANKPFIIERPKIFYRSDQDMIFYQAVKQGDYCLVKSKEGYNSVHYIINKDGKYIEIQVRTIYDEAWSECTHDIVYKSALKGGEKKKELEYISKCLAQQTIAAENMVNYMYEMVNGSNTIYNSVEETDNSFSLKDVGTISEKSSIMKINIGQRIKKLRQESEEKFSGNIDDLI